MKWFLCVFLCIPLSQAQSCSKYIDLVIVVESSNITSYQDKRTTTWHPAIQMFLTSLLDGLTLGAEFFRVAVVLYSSSIDDVMTFTVDREFAQHAVTFLRPNFGGANLHMGLEEMNRLYQYYSRPGATKRALLVTGSHIGDSSSTFAEVWQARIMNVDLLAIGFGGNELEHELKQMASDFVVTIGDIGMLYALVTRALERICIDPVDGAWSSWMNWGTCTASCNGGYRSRARSCSSPQPSLGGHLCDGMPSQTEICNTHGCQDEWGAGSWSSWSDCSTSCGSGRRVRTRWCRDQCSDREVETQFQPCSKAECPSPVNGSWTAWGEWSPCDCHTKTRHSRRECSNPPPANGGQTCTGLSVNVSDCLPTDVDQCPEDGSWSFWSEWSTCSKTCGQGISSRTRQCDNPVPRNGGSECSGTKFDQRRCNQYTLCQDCPHKPLQHRDGWYMMRFYDSWVPQRCSDGEVFSMESCDCIADPNIATGPRCDNVVDLDFVSHNEEARDDLGERESTASNVNYDGEGNAVFSSDSSVVLWQFYQMELDSGFRISVRVKPDAGPGPMRTLLSDDDCSSSERPSIVIGFKTIENNTVHVIFGLSLQNRGAMSFLNITTRVDDFLDLNFHFTGRRFGGEVKNKLTEIIFPETELVQARRGPLVIGNNMCSNLQGFQGLLNQIQLFSC